MILDATATAFHGTLTGGTALTVLLAGTTSVYYMQAPDEASLDYVVYSHQGGGPDTTSPGKAENNLWYVRAYSATSPKQAAVVFTQADALLNQVNISIAGVSTFWCQRETNINLVETLPNNRKVFSAGGIYRVRTGA